MRWATRHRHAGSTLVQLLIGSAIGLSLAAGLSTFFIQGSRSSREDINVSAMLNELSFAAGQIAGDLEMAGFWARVHDPSGIDKDGTLAVSGDCGATGWYQNLTALEVQDNKTATQIHAIYPCLPEADLVDGSDVIAIKRVYGRVAGTDTDSSGMHNGTIYLRTHDKYGRLYLQGGSAPAVVDTPYQNWEYAPVIYYVQKYTLSPTESPRVPSLCRMTLRSSSGGAPAFTKECIAQGIEMLQVEIGVDTDEDGGSNYFTPAPTTEDLNRASTVRLYLLARSARRDVDYVNPKTYRIGNMPSTYPPAGSDMHYHRKTLSTEVVLRNPRALQGIAVQ